MSERENSQPLVEKDPSVSVDALDAAWTIYMAAHNLRSTMHRMTFDAGYHARDAEVADLRAENARLRKSAMDWNHQANLYQIELTGLPTALKEARAAVTRLEAANAEARTALERARPVIAFEAESVEYGPAFADDPRDFKPDPECSEEYERAAHKAACEAFERGEMVEIPRCYTRVARNPEEAAAVAKTEMENGAAAVTVTDRIVHVNVQSWGLGTTTTRDPNMAATLEVIDAFLAHPEGATGAAVIAAAEQVVTVCLKVIRHGDTIDLKANHDAYDALLAAVAAYREAHTGGMGQ